MKKRILYLFGGSLRNPIKGTPLRVYNILRQIEKKHTVFLCVSEPPLSYNKKFVFFPKAGSWWFLRELVLFIREEKINTLFFCTDSKIKLGVFLKLFTKCKIVIDLHGLSQEELYYFGLIGKYKKRIYNIRNRFFLYFYDLVFVVSQKMQNYYLFKKNDIRVIYGGASFFNKPIYKRISPVFSVGYAGNIKSYQGLGYLLDAIGNLIHVRKIPINLNLILSGEVDKIHTILQRRSFLGQINLHCNIRHSQVFPILAKSNVLTIPRPSLPMTEYAFPSKLSEYLAMGIPVIVTEVGPVGELLTHGVDSIIINKSDISLHLEKALYDFYRLSDSQRFAIAINGYKRACKILDWNLLGKKINDYLFDL